MALHGHDYRAFVHAGTCVEYGPRMDPIREGEALDPRTPSAVAKATASLVCGAEARRGRPIRLIPGLMLGAVRLAGRGSARDRVLVPLGLRGGGCPAGG